MRYLVVLTPVSYTHLDVYKRQDLGITRLIPTLAESDAIKHGTLTNDEKNRYRAIFYNRTATVTTVSYTHLDVYKRQWL